MKTDQYRRFEAERASRVEALRAAGPAAALRLLTGYRNHTVQALIAAGELSEIEPLTAPTP